MQKHRVLIVDDDPSWQGGFQEIIENLNSTKAESELEAEQYAVWVARSYEEAEATLDRQHFHLALIDLRLQEGVKELQGKKLVQRIRKSNEGTNTIIVTGFADATVATELLKQENAFYLIEKDKFDSTQFANLVKDAISRSQEQYRSRFESAMDFLRGNRDIHSWAAEVLQAILRESRASRIDDLDNLRDLLNGLLVDLYPLLYHRMYVGAVIDSRANVVGVRCWSKALGEPVLIKFGQQERIDLEVEGVGTHPEILAQRAFARIERMVKVGEFGGVVYVPIPPPFEDFGSGV